ncbi:hypothetical protein ACN27F_01515 [Solwaraspora sp. WMMB335]|uniref:hypothetical protein n=1 Tax=Solwaraspora sp. WMMB335 TaxID=3404118 RepID=UPI003B95CA06
MADSTGREPHPTGPLPAGADVDPPTGPRHPPVARPGAPAQAADGPPWSPFPRQQTWLQRRRDKIAAEIARNRRGEYTVPTWVLALALGLIIAAWAFLIVIS